MLLEPDDQQTHRSGTGAVGGTAHHFVDERPPVLQPPFAKMARYADQSSRTGRAGVAKLLQNGISVGFEFRMVKAAQGVHVGGFSGLMPEELPFALTKSYEALHAELFSFRRATRTNLYAFIP
ncbi:hypothetical protein ABII15_30710 [Streptomyces sp. HUAS MG91]|uniref:Uncharacterized protein n=1 Tax=Streptomyces tabacisoli TaxID=3156398 RepID=A0AAU8J1W5_9ACTN